MATTSTSRTSTLAHTTITALSTTSNNTSAFVDHRPPIRIPRIPRLSIAAVAAIPTKQTGIAAIATGRAPADTHTTIPALRRPEARDVRSRVHDRTAVRVARVPGLCVATIASVAGSVGARVASVAARGRSGPREATVAALS